jgi:predicted metalloprotease with PDZ domain
MTNRLFRMAMFLAVTIFSIHAFGPAACAASSAAAQSSAAPLKYELAFEHPNTHLIDVVIHASDLRGPAAEFAIPDWAPGSYYIENYSANVQRFRATSADGKALTWRKTDSQTWQIDLTGATAVTVAYQVFANTLQNNIAQYNERHAFIGGPSVWMYLVDGKERPIELSVAAPSGWKIATGMEHTSDHTFRAADYNWFADAPFEISDFVEKDFEVLGTTYHVIVHDVESKKDFTKYANDLQKTVASIVPLFQSVTGTPQAAPFKEYYFIFHVWPKTGGGLEHLNSTQINFTTDWDSTEPLPGTNLNQYDLKLFVASHEFFHAWNVKRLRPLPLGPFDYTQMVHTPSLWISEGLTSYYGSLQIERAGLIPPQQYLDSIARLITNFEAKPGRKERSIEDTSWDTWFSNPMSISQANNLANTYYSYYDGGQIVGHILDFAIRDNTNNQKSLDDWMRLLYSRYALPKPGFKPEDAIHAANEVAGKDVSDLFRRYISGMEPIPYEQYFALAGIEVTKKVDPDKAWVGVELKKSDDGHAQIRNVIPGSPAETAGLSNDDVIYAIDSRALDSDGVNAQLASRKPGDTLRVSVLRLGEFKEFLVTPTTNPNPTYSLKPMENQTEKQKAIYNSWLGIKP